MENSKNIEEQFQNYKKKACYRSFESATGFFPYLINDFLESLEFGLLTRKGSTFQVLLPDEVLPLLF